MGYGYAAFLVGRLVLWAVWYCLPVYCVVRLFDRVENETTAEAVDRCTKYSCGAIVFYALSLASAYLLGANNGTIPLPH